MIDASNLLENNTIFYLRFWSRRRPFLVMLILLVIEVLLQHWRVDHLRAGMPRTLRLPGHCQQVPAFPCRGRRVHGSARTARHGGRVRQRSGSLCAEGGSERAGQLGDCEGLDDDKRSRRRRPRGI